MYKGGVHKHVSGYKMILCPNHPRKGGSYVMEHILIMEKKIDRYLTEDECVHHLNGIKEDNREENLELCKDASEHMAKHKGTDGKFKKFKEGNDATIKSNRHDDQAHADNTSGTT